MLLQLQDVGRTCIRKTTATHHGGTHPTWTRSWKPANAAGPPARNGIHLTVWSNCSHMHQSKPGAVSPASDYTHSSISPTQKVTRRIENGHTHFLNATFEQKSCPENFFFRGDVVLVTIIFYFPLFLLLP